MSNPKSVVESTRPKKLNKVENSEKLKVEETAKKSQETITDTTEKILQGEQSKKVKISTKIGLLTKKYLISLLDFLKLCLTSPKDAKLKCVQMWESIKSVMHHLWLNCKVWWVDMKTGFKLGSRYIRGYELSRRESKRLVQAIGDSLRMVPFSFFIIVPFLEFTLPFFLMVKIYSK